MYPMRDHLYELAKVREIELMEQARRRQQLEEAQGYHYAEWSLEPLRRLWQKVLGRTGRTTRANMPTARKANFPPVNVFEG